MLFWIYIAITLFIAVIVVVELFSEKDWKKQVALAMLLLPFVLRVLLIK